MGYKDKGLSIEVRLSADVAGVIEMIREAGARCPVILGPVTCECTGFSKEPGQVDLVARDRSFRIRRNSKGWVFIHGTEWKSGEKESERYPG